MLRGTQKSLCFILITVTLLAAFNMSALACTGLQLIGDDGTVVRGRTMEWGEFDMHSELAVVPSGTRFVSKTPDGKKGFSWEGDYGFAGVEVLGRAVCDGMNEKGLSAGMFYHSGFADYGKFDPKDAGKSLSPDDVIHYILSECATLDDVRKAFDEVKVEPVEDKDFGNPVPMHLMVSDPDGKNIVIEFLGGSPVFYDNPVGVITNNPTFDWHLTNLRNYGFLSKQPFPTKQWGDLKITPLAAGSGFLGLPGDFTAPSRFVRAVVFSQTSRKTSGGLDTAQELFRILDNFNLGSEQAEGSVPDGEVAMPGATQWTVATDSKNMVLYYHTMYNRRLRKLDMKTIDFDKGAPRSVPLDAKRKQDIKDVSDKLQ